MKELIAAVVASAFVLGSASGFAAGTVSKPELTKEERMEMHTRADQLTAQRDAAPLAVKDTAAPKATTKPTHKAKKHSSKSKKASTHTHPKT